MKAFSLALTLISLSLFSADDPPPDFNRDIRPILSGTCFKCHGMDDKARKSGLRLDIRDVAVKPAKSGETAIVPGHPDQSELITRIYSDDVNDIMPPPSTHIELTNDQKKLLKRWIADGAPYAPHWAFVAPVRTIPPNVKLGEIRNPIDAFVGARLIHEGLQPSPEADRRTLCRRVSLDLIGLPPTPEQAAAFEKDTAPDAYEKLVDQLLASPRYGERWARRWLDLARYADTNGYEKDRQRVIWPYRDWVIRALNADMPFDQFTIKQLAGDMLPNATPDDIVATGFHRNTMLNEEGGADPNEFRYYSTIDRTNTTATAWLGLTAGCAQCHTHKFDPLRHEEYYQLTAFLDNADEPDYFIPDPEKMKARAELEAKIAKLTAELPTKWKPVTGATWNTPAKFEAKSQHGATAAVLADNSIKFSGLNPDTDTYTITFETAALEPDRLRLETLKDGQSGPGRTPHGNFVLNEIRLEAASLDAPEKFEPVKLARASADHSQPEFDVSGAIDGDAKTGWAVDGGKSGVQPRTATFFFDKPAVFKTAARWRVTLEQNHGTKHTLARFRLTLGSRPTGSAGILPATGIAGFQPASFSGGTPAAEDLQRKFSAWEKVQSAQAIDWKILRPAEIKTNLTHIEQLEDGSLLASGDVTKSDTYDLKFNDTIKAVTALRLEVLPHDSLPGGGPGLAFYEGPKGDFFLSELHFLLSGVRQKVARAAQSFPNGKNGAVLTQDGNMSSGWTTSGALGQPHSAVFTFDKPLDLDKNFALKMQFERHYACPLGRFRISVTTDTKPADSNFHSAELEAALLGAPLGAQASSLPRASSPKPERSEPQRKLIFDAFLAEAPELAEARKEIAALRAQLPKLQSTLVLRERPATNPRPTFVHHRGEYTQPEAKVEPNVPAFLPPLPPGPRNRLTFAQWIASPQNPLTARVTVNRQWQAFFGRGIVRTLEDFGYQGEPPSHPELLDWLALEFIDKGWSLKKLHKLIVMSATYRQSSRVTKELAQRDPPNILLARGPRVRLEAEVLRDSVLAECGLLSAKMYGPGSFPPQLPSITTEGAYGPMTWTPSPGEDRWRRSVYTFMKRTAPFAMYATFDGPTGEACLARREVSNSPLQALTLLNDQIFVESAQALGAKLATLSPLPAGGEGQGEGARITELFTRILSRPPTKDELAAVTFFLKNQRARFDSKELNPAAINGKPGDDNTDKALWTLAARSILNLDEACTKR